MMAMAKSLAEKRAFIRAAEKDHLEREAILDEMFPAEREALLCACPTCVLSYLTDKILATSNPEYALETITGDLSALVNLRLHAVGAHGLH